MGDYERYSELVPELFDRLTRGTADQQEALLVMETVFVCLFDHHKTSPRIAIEFMDTMTQRVMQRLAEKPQVTD